jgi:hypothetical protein
MAATFKVEMHFWSSHFSVEYSYRLCVWASVIVSPLKALGQFQRDAKCSFSLTQQQCFVSHGPKKRGQKICYYTYTCILFYVFTDQDLMEEIRQRTKESSVASLPKESSVASLPNELCPVGPEATSKKESIPKVWPNKERAMLFSLRAEMEADFQSHKAHSTLWHLISDKLKEQGCIATSVQCDNKFKSLKREYRVAIDHNQKSGNDKKTCPFYEEFNRLYGFKASTAPAFTMGSINVDHVEAVEGEELPTLTSPKATLRKRQKKVKRVDGTPEWITDYEQRQVERQEKRAEERNKMHTDRLNIMERMLDIMEEKKTNKN